MSTRTFALVTGASQGLGKVFAQALAARGQNVILVARSKDRLEGLADELRHHGPVAAEVLVADLASPSAGTFLAREILSRGHQINLLINNAGFGLRGEFSTLPLERQMQMVRLNNDAVVELTYSLLPLLRQQPSAGIINVASAAGFQPIPYASLYAATKSFLMNFSMGLEQELRSSGIRVVTLCPGRILSEAQLADGKDKRKSRLVYQSPQHVVRDALLALEKSGGLTIPGFTNKFSIFAQRLIPRRVVPKLVAKMSRQ